MRTAIFATLAASLCTCALARSVAAPAAAQVVLAPAGSYQQSCTDIQVSGDDLSAMCRDMHGVWRLTQADIEDCPSRTFANVDGALACGRGGYGIGDFLPAGAWRATCRNASETGMLLRAECESMTGSWNATSLFMPACPSRVLDNQDGSLVCRGGSIAWLPAGSWQQSCRDGMMQGSVLVARCDAGDGSWRQTSLDLAADPGARVANLRGSLVFETPLVYRWLQ